MKDTVKLAVAMHSVAIALAALIGFASCNNENGPDNTPKPGNTPTISDRTSYINDGDQVVFSVLSGIGGTYTLKSQEQKRDDDGNYIWQPKMEGSYAQNQSAQTVTLTPEKVADDDGLMTDKADAMPLFAAWIGEEIENEIEGRLAWSSNPPHNEDPDDAAAAVLESRNELYGTAYITLDELIDALALIRFDETFASLSYTYTFSTDGASLILLQALPAPVGTDELAGKTYYGTIIDWLTEASEPDPEQEYAFSAAGRTYTASDSDSESSSGTYSYNSDVDVRRVYFKPAKKNGLTPEQFYDETPYYAESDRYPSEADSRASQTHQYFKLWNYDYDPDARVIKTDRAGGDIEPLSYQ